jgi:hypothetical protein
VTPREALQTVLDEEHADAVIEHRRVTIRKPLTAYAAKLLAKRFLEWGDPNQAAEIMIERAWQGFNVNWVRDRPKPNAPQSTGHAMLDALMVGRTPH